MFVGYKNAVRYGGLFGVGDEGGTWCGLGGIDGAYMYLVWDVNA
jgi:hypothetical protein